jgi:hypothetical protein
MQHVPSSIPDLIDAFGGSTAFARIIGLKPSTASEMKRRQSIPVPYWPKVVEAAGEKNIIVNNDLLVRLHAAEKASAA